MDMYHPHRTRERLIRAYRSKPTQALTAALLAAAGAIIVLVQLPGPWDKWVVGLLVAAAVLALGSIWKEKKE